MSDSIIAQDVTKSFARDGERVEVLKGVSLTIAAGELAAIVGPSGVGKSTLLHLLGGLERPTSGAIRYGDTDLAVLSDLALARFRNRRVGFVFQFHHLLPEFSALENVMMPLLIRRCSTTEAQAQSTALLGRAGCAVAAPPRRVVGRRAAAGGHRPGADRGARGVAGGRADGKPGQQDGG